MLCYVMLCYVVRNMLRLVFIDGSLNYSPVSIDRGSDIGTNSSLILGVYLITQKDFQDLVHYSIKYSSASFVFLEP